jgi:hypothetical protein
LQHVGGEMRVVSEPVAERNRQRQDPLPDGSDGKNVIDEKRRRLCHAAPAAGRADSAPLTAKRDNAVAATLCALETDEAVRENSSLQIRAQLAFDEGGHSAADRFGAREKRLALIAHGVVKDRFLGDASRWASHRGAV